MGQEAWRRVFSTRSRTRVGKVLLLVVGQRLDVCRDRTAELAGECALGHGRSSCFMSMGIEASAIRVGELGAYLARPQGGARAGVLLLPMVTGLSARVRWFADEVARAGLTALAWDVWHGDSIDDTPRAALDTRLRRLEDEVALREQRLLLDHLDGELGCARTGVMGWSLGGRFSLLLAARDRRIRGVVACYPTIRETPPSNHVLDAVEEVKRIKVPVMVHYPQADHLISRTVFDRLQTALQGRAKGATFTSSHPGAEHGFSDPSAHGNPVNAQAFALSWGQTVAFLQEITSGRS